MIRGLYTAASGMLANTIATDTLANNLANISTTGFKRNNVNFQSFPELLLHRMSSSDESQVGRIATGSTLRSTQVYFAQGALKQTGNPLDMAIEGDGFFTMQLDNGQKAYTRNGTFTLNNDGKVVDMNGNMVLDDVGAPIVLPVNGSEASGEIQISSTGDISVGGTSVGKIGVTHFKNNHSLVRLGDSLFLEGPTSEIVNSTDLEQPIKVHQGSLEMSNTNAVSEMVNSITGLRLYEALQRSIRVQNDTLDKAVNEVGRL